MSKLNKMDNVLKARLSSETKRANQRLRELEKQGLTNASAYRYIQNKFKDGSQLFALDSKGRVKFRTDVSHIPQQQLANFQNVIQHFLDKKTSTVRGIKKTQQNAYETFIKNHPELNISLNEYQLLWESKVFRTQAGVWSSEVAIDVISSIYEHKGNMTETLQFLDEHRNAYVSFFEEESSYNDNPFEDNPLKQQGV